MFYIQFTACCLKKRYFAVYNYDVNKKNSK